MAKTPTDPASAALTHEQRIQLVALGWQAECAAQIGASHLCTSWRYAIGNSIPATFDECVELGRATLRTYLAKVRGDAETPADAATVDASKAPDGTDGPLGTKTIRADVAVTRTSSTRQQTTHSFFVSRPTETIAMFWERVRLEANAMLRSPPGP